LKTVIDFDKVIYRELMQKIRGMLVKLLKECLNKDIGFFEGSRHHHIYVRSQISGKQFALKCLKNTIEVLDLWYV